MAIVLVEQYPGFACDPGDSFYVLQRGAVMAKGRKAEMSKEQFRQGL